MLDILSQNAYLISVGGKRKKNTANWKNKRKRLRAHDKAYEQARKKNGQAVIRKARKMRPTLPSKMHATLQ